MLFFKIKNKFKRKVHLTFTNSRNYQIMFSILITKFFLRCFYLSKYILISILIFFKSTFLFLSLFSTLCQHFIIFIYSLCQKYFQVGYPRLLCVIPKRSYLNFLGVFFFFFIFLLFFISNKFYSFLLKGLFFTLISFLANQFYFLNSEFLPTTGIFFSSLNELPLLFSKSESILSSLAVFYHFSSFNYIVPFLFFDFSYYYSVFFMDGGYLLPNVSVFQQFFGLVTSVISFILYGGGLNFTFIDYIESEWFFYQLYTMFFFQNLNNVMLGGPFNGNNIGFYYTADYLVDYSYYSRGLFHEILLTNFVHFFDLQSTFYFDFCFYNYKRNRSTFDFGLFSLASHEPFFFFTLVAGFMWFGFTSFILQKLGSFLFNVKSFILSLLNLGEQLFFKFLKIFEITLPGFSSLNETRAGFLEFYNNEVANYYYRHFTFFVYLCWGIIRKVFFTLFTPDFEVITSFFKNVFRISCFHTFFHAGLFIYLKNCYFLIKFFFFKHLNFLLTVSNQFLANFSRVTTYYHLREFFLYYYYVHLLNLTLTLLFRGLNIVLFVFTSITFGFYVLAILSHHFSYIYKFSTNTFSLFYKTLYYFCLKFFKTIFILHLIIDKAVISQLVFSYFDNKVGSFFKYKVFRNSLYFFFDQINLTQTFISQFTLKNSFRKNLSWSSLSERFFFKLISPIYFSYAIAVFRLICFIFLNLICFSFFIKPFTIKKVVIASGDHSCSEVKLICSTLNGLNHHLFNFDFFFDFVVHQQSILYLDTGRPINIQFIPRFSELFGYYYHSFGSILFTDFGFFAQVYSFIISHLLFGPWNSIYFGFHRPLMFDFSILFPINLLVEQFWYIMVLCGETNLGGIYVDTLIRQGFDVYPPINKVITDYFFTISEKDSWISRVILTFDYYIWHFLRISVIDFIQVPYYKYRFQVKGLSSVEPLSIEETLFDRSYDFSPPLPFSGISYPRIFDYYHPSSILDYPLTSLSYKMKPFKDPSVYTMSEGSLFFDNEKMVPNLYFSNGYHGFPQLNSSKSAYIRPTKFKQLDLIYDFTSATKYPKINIDCSPKIAKFALSEDHPTLDLSYLNELVLRTFFPSAYSSYKERAIVYLKKIIHYSNPTSSFLSTTQKLNDKYLFKSDFWWNPSLFYSSRVFGLVDRNSQEHYPTLFLKPRTTFIPLSEILGGGAYSLERFLLSSPVNIGLNSKISPLQLTGIRPSIDNSIAPNYSRFAFGQIHNIMSFYHYYNHLIANFHLPVMGLGNLVEPTIFSTLGYSFFGAKFAGFEQSTADYINDQRQTSAVYPKAAIFCDKVCTNYYQAVPLNNGHTLYGDYYIPSSNLVQKNLNLRDPLSLIDADFISTYNHFSTKQYLNAELPETSEEHQVANVFFNSWTKNPFESFCILFNNIILLNWFYIIFFTLVYSLVFCFLSFFLYLIIKIIIKDRRFLKFPFFSIYFFFELYKAYGADRKVFNKVAFSLFEKEYSNKSSYFEKYLSKNSYILSFFNIDLSLFNSFFFNKNCSNLLTTNTLKEQVVNSNIYMLKEIYAFQQKDVHLTQYFLNSLKNSLSNSGPYIKNSKSLQKFLLFNLLFSKKSELNRLFKLESKYGFNDVALKKMFEKADWFQVAANYFSSFDVLYFNYFYDFTKKTGLMGKSETSLFKTLVTFSTLPLFQVKGSPDNEEFTYIFYDKSHPLFSMIDQKLKKYSFYFSDIFLLDFISYSILENGEQALYDMFLENYGDLNDEFFQESDEVHYEFFNLDTPEIFFRELDNDNSILFSKQFYNFIIEDSAELTYQYELDLDDQEAEEDGDFDFLPGLIEQEHADAVLSFFELNIAEDMQDPGFSFGGENIEPLYGTRSSDIFETLLCNLVLKGDTAPRYASYEANKKRLLYHSFGTLDAFMDNTFFETNDYVNKEAVLQHSYFIYQNSLTELYSRNNPLFSNYGEYSYLYSLTDSVEDLDSQVDLSSRESLEEDLEYPKHQSDLSFFKGYNPYLSEYNNIFNTLDDFGDDINIQQIPEISFLKQLKKIEPAFSFKDFLNIFFLILNKSSIYNISTFNFNKNYEFVPTQHKSRIPGDFWFLTFEALQKRYQKRGLPLSRDLFSILYHHIQLKEFLQGDFPQLTLKSELINDLLKERAVIVERFLSNHYNNRPKAFFDRKNPLEIGFSQEFSWLVDLLSGLQVTSLKVDATQELDRNWFNSLFLSKPFFNGSLQSFLFQTNNSFSNLNIFPDIFEKNSQYLYEAGDFNENLKYLAFTESSYSLVFEYNNFLNFDVTYETVEKPLLLRDYFYQFLFNQHFPVDFFSGSAVQGSSAGKDLFLLKSFRYHIDDITQKITHKASLTNTVEFIYVLLATLETPLKSLVYPSILNYFFCRQNTKRFSSQYYTRYLFQNINWTLLFSDIGRTTETNSFLNLPNLFFKKHITNNSKDIFSIIDLEYSNQLEGLTEIYNSSPDFIEEKTGLASNFFVAYPGEWASLFQGFREDGMSPIGFHTDAFSGSAIPDDLFFDKISPTVDILHQSNFYWNEGLKSLEKSHLSTQPAIFHEKLDLLKQSSAFDIQLLKKYHFSNTTNVSVINNKVDFYVHLSDFYWLLTPHFFSNKVVQGTSSFEKSFLLNEAYLFNFTSHLTEFENTNYNEKFLQFDNPLFSGVGRSVVNPELDQNILQKTFIIPTESVISPVIQEFEFSSNLQITHGIHKNTKIFLNDFNMKTLLSSGNYNTNLTFSSFIIFRLFNFLYYYLAGYYSLKYSSSLHGGQKVPSFYSQIVKFLSSSQFHLTSFADLSFKMFHPLKFFIHQLFLLRFLYLRASSNLQAFKKYIFILKLEYLPFIYSTDWKSFFNEWPLYNPTLKRFFRYFFVPTLFQHHFVDSFSFLDPLKVRYLSYKNLEFTNYLKSFYVTNAHSFFFYKSNNHSSLSTFENFTFFQKSLLLFLLLKYNYQKKYTDYYRVFNNYQISYPAITSFFFIFYHIPYFIGTCTQQFFSEFTAFFVKPHASFSLPSFLNICLTGKNKFFENLGINDINYFQPIELVGEKLTPLKPIDIIFNRFSYRFNTVFFHFDQLLLKKYFSFGFLHVSMPDKVTYSIVNVLNYIGSWFFLYRIDTLPFFLQLFNAEVRLSFGPLNNFWLFIHRSFFQFKGDFDVQVNSLFYNDANKYERSTRLTFKFLRYLKYYKPIYRYIIETFGDFSPGVYDASSYDTHAERPFNFFNGKSRIRGLSYFGTLEMKARNTLISDILYRDSIIKSLIKVGKTERDFSLSSPSTERIKKKLFSLYELPEMGNRFVDYFYTIVTKKRKRSFSYFNSTDRLIAHEHRFGFLNRRSFNFNSMGQPSLQVYYGRRMKHFVPYTSQKSIYRGYLLQDFKVRWLQKTLYYGLYHANHFEQRRLLKSAFIQRYYFLKFFTFSVNKSK